MRLKILLIVLGSLLIGSGVFLATTKFRSSSDNSGSVTVSQEVAAESADDKDDSKKEESKEEIKGATQYVPPKNYQPTAKSKATAKKVTQTKQAIKKPEEKQSPPDISEDTGHPFSDEHIQGYIDNNNEYQDVLDQMNALYLQSLALYQEYLDAPETVYQRTRNSGISQSRLNMLIEAEEERILHELDVLELEYLRLEYRLDQLDYELCSTYFDILYYLGYESYCY